MANQQFNRLSLRCRVTPVLLPTTLLVAALIAHSLIARAYYSLNSQRLEVVASMAVRVGAEYLPANPACCSTDC